MSVRSAVRRARLGRAVALLAVALSVAPITASAAAAGPANVYAWGANFAGQLGNGTTNPSSVPGTVGLPDGVTPTAISAGASYNLALTSTGDVWGWGTLGQEADTPVKVTLPAGVTAAGVSAGSGLSEGTYFSMVVSTGGAVYDWGGNGNGELGDGGSESFSASPVQAALPAGVTATAVAAGGDHALALASTGAIYAWGYNHSGQLGDGNRDPSGVPVKVRLPTGVTATQVAAAGDNSLALTSTGAVYGWGATYGDFTDAPILINLPTGITATSVSTGRGSGLVLTSTGAVYALQQTDTGTVSAVQVQFPAGVTATAVAAGNQHDLALDSTGTVYAWGANADGQLGDNSTTDSPTPVQAQLPAGMRAAAISAGGRHSLALAATPGVPARLAFAAQPSGGTAGSAFATQPAVVVEDFFGATISGDSSQVTLSITSGTGSSDAALACESNPVSAASGVAGFTGCNVIKSGTGYTLRATDGTLIPAVSAPFDITPGQPKQLAFVTQPSGGVAGTVLAAQPAVAVEDAFGNVVTADTSQVLLTFTPGTTPLNGILSCPLNPLRAVSGIATFSRCTVNAARSGYRLRATDGGLTRADSAPFDITAGPPASVDFVAQPSRAIAGSPFAAQPVVAVEDALGNLVSTDSSAVTLTITRGTGTKGATLTCQANPLQASAGMAGFSGCAIDFPGLGYQLHASDGALAPADSEPFQVSSNIGVKLAFVTQPAGATLGAAFATQPAVAVEDAAGHVVKFDSSAITLSIRPGTGFPGATFACASNPLSATFGTARFSGCAISKAGNGYVVHATDGNLAPVDSAPFDVKAASPLDHGRSLIGQVADHPPFAIGDGPARPTRETRKTVTFTVIDSGRTQATTARTDGKGNYRIDHIPDPCAPGASQQCYVSVGDAAGTIQDSRRVYLGPDPSTTTQNLDWAHVPDRHAISGPVTHTTHGAYIKILAPAGANKAEIVLGQTKPRTCGGGPGKGGGAACVIPVAWRLEAIDPTAAQFPGQRTVQADVQLWLGVNDVDSTDITIPVDPGGPTDTPQAAAQALAGDIAVPTLDGSAQPGHGRSLIGRVADHPPFAIGEGPPRPTLETRRTVTLSVLDSSATHTTTTKTDSKGNYRIDHIPDACAPATRDECYVSVTDSAGTIQDSRRVYLGPDPSTTTQDLDWGHIPDRHAIYGPVTHTITGAYIKILAPIPGKPDMLLGQTKPRTCGGGSGKGAGPACVTPLAWRLEAIDRAQAQFPNQTEITAVVQLIEPSQRGDVPVDSTGITIPLDPGTPTNAPQTAAEIPAADIAAPALDGGTGPPVDHGRSLAGRVTDTPPFAIGDGTASKHIPQKDKTVTLTLVRGTHADTVATARTDNKGNYRIDHIPDACAPATTDECYVSVTAAGGSIQDSRRVYLGPDPSTTTQDLDWGHIPDRHAIGGTVSHTITGAYIKILAPIPGKPDQLLGQTKPRTCGSGSGKGGGPACANPLAWRLETIDPAQAQFPQQTEITAEVQLIEPSRSGDIAVDSAEVTIPLDPGTATNTPQTAAEIPAGDITAPNLQGLSVAGGSG